MFCLLLFFQSIRHFLRQFNFSTDHCSLLMIRLSYSGCAINLNEPRYEQWQLKGEQLTLMCMEAGVMALNSASKRGPRFGRRDMPPARYMLLLKFNKAGNVQSESHSDLRLPCHFSSQVHTTRLYRFQNKLVNSLTVETPNFRIKKSFGCFKTRNVEFNFSFNFEKMSRSSHTV